MNSRVPRSASACPLLGPLARAIGVVGAVFSPWLSDGGDWPQWRGPARDGHAAVDEAFPASLPPDFSPIWTVSAGTAFSSPIVVGSMLFHVDQQAGQETAHALDAMTGRTIWSAPYGQATGDEWGSGPRCTPLSSDGLLFVQSLRGDFACLDQRDGRRLWGFGFERDYGVVYLGGADQSDSAARRRGNTGSPVVVGDRIFVPVGSTNDATVVCFDKRTGREIWRSGRDEAAYAPLVAGAVGGRSTVIAYTAFSLLGLDANDGSAIWRIPLRSHANRHAVTPILHGDAATVFSHTLGGRSFRFVPAAATGAITVQENWSEPRLKTSLATTVRVGDHLYGQGPDRNLVCIDLASGKVVWSQPGFGDKPLTGYSSTTASGKRLLVLSENGQLALVEASPAGYRELGRQQVCGKTWSHPAVAAGLLFVRDGRQLLAFRLSKS